MFVSAAATGTRQTAAHFVWLSEAPSQVMAHGIRIPDSLL